MSDQFFPQSCFSLLSEILDQFDHQKDILALPYDQIFNPKDYPHLKMKRYGQKLATPYGIAAGPHSQLARNIVSSWLMGARYVELKTIQYLDELTVPKPCIDMKDEGYNCEWSQELRVEQSFNEYLNAWVIIHVLAHKMKMEEGPETIFNMSVGYDMRGILEDNVQWYFNQMSDASDWILQKKQELKSLYPPILELSIPSEISNNITLSTMHGCPPDEVEQISRYLITDKKWHTTIKLNPTLLGAGALRKILNEKLKYPIDVPELAFEHDIQYDDALVIIRNLWNLSKEYHLDFAVKLTNTLEVSNTTASLSEDRVYMSGRALHPISVNVAAKLQAEFNGELDISFSAGADAYNLLNLVQSGLIPVTVSSDLLKPGGYGRLAQYSECCFNNELFSLDKKKYQQEKLQHLLQYAVKVLLDQRYSYSFFDTKNIKSDSELHTFDCIAAPCMDACPTEQDIPDYLYLASKGLFNEALDVIYQKNPLPRTLGLVCEHSCQAKCTRVNYDQTLRIRDIKEYIANNGEASLIQTKPDNGIKVAIIGAGPSGLSAAWFLQLEGCQVDVFEKSNNIGGLPKSIIPDFRLNEKALNDDIDRILELGVNIHLGQDMNPAEIEKLEESFDYIYLATGTKLNRKLNIPGIDDERVIDPLEFLEKHKLQEIGQDFRNVIVIGGGNTAIDVARMAKKAQKGQGKVTLVYRRTLKFMPAEKQEILEALDEGILIKELLSPKEILRTNHRVALLLQPMLLSDRVGADGRKKVKPSEQEPILMETDCIIPALGQRAMPLLDSFYDISKPMEFHEETKVFGGGDMSRGGSSIVQAVADGRTFAEMILKINELKQESSPKDIAQKISAQDHLKIRSLRQHSQYPIHNKGISANQVMNEAARCLQCDEYCNICVTVCPNRANQSFNMLPAIYHYYHIQVKGRQFELIGPIQSAVHQRSQVYNVADYCNECGNCSTFCPTNGDPYKDKAQIHLSKQSFEHSDQGYHYAHEILFYKHLHYTAQLQEEAGKYIFEDDRVEVILAKDHLKILDVFIKEEGSYQVDMSLLIDMKILKEDVFQK